MIFEINETDIFKQKALQWAALFNVACCLNSNGFTDPYAKFDVLIAAGVKQELTASDKDAFEKLADFRKTHPGWMTGFLGYDLKNTVEKLQSSNADHLLFPDLYFFVPQHLIIIKGSTVEIESDNAEATFRSINKTEIIEPVSQTPDLTIRPRFSKVDYLQTVNKIKEHISRGDIYVTNFCQEFYAEDTLINPLEVYKKLVIASPNPFASFFKHYDKYILCASPERFLAKRQNKLISQPIKGTAKRGGDAVADDDIRHQLKNNAKEQQENVMIVDLVRNDLTRSAVSGTVKVDELFGIYSFKHVHQMISTVVCELDSRITAVEAIKNTFPMGSMTGAPKVSAMQLMEQYELTKRGVYSGAIGYFSPDGDFDFNVVIRSILYNATKKYLSFQAGSAITYHADAESEFEECLLKVKAILEVLGQPISYPLP